MHHDSYHSDYEQDKPKKSWWKPTTWFDWDDDQYQKPDTSKWVSPSRYLNSYGQTHWGGAWGGYYSTSNVVYQLREAIRNVRKNANLILNGSDGEQQLEVSFAKPRERNDFDGKEFKLDLDHFLAPSGSLLQGDDMFDAVDSATGQVMLGSQLRRQADPHALQEYIHGQPGPRTVYRHLEEEAAYQQIAEDWIGFTPYLDSYREHFHASRQQLVAVLQPLNPQILTAVYCWNRVHPHERINLSESLQQHWLNRPSLEVEEEFCQLLEQPCPAADRYQHARKAFQIVQDAFKRNPNPPTEKQKKYIPRAAGTGLFDDQVTEDQHSLGADTAEEASREIKGGYCTSTEHEEFEPFYDVRKPIEQASQAKYQEFVRLHRKKIEYLRNRFQFHNVSCNLYDHGLTSGQLDEHALTKLSMQDYERLFSRQTVISTKDAAVALLIDQSGSMAGHEIVVARETAILLREALRKINDVQLLIYGHTAQMRPITHGSQDDDEYDTVEHYKQVQVIPYLDKDQDHCRDLIVAPALCNNLDGHAIRYVAGRLLNLNVQRRILLVLSDGSPAGFAYSRGVQHTRDVITASRSLGVETYAVGVSGFRRRDGDVMYGENNYVLLHDIERSLTALAGAIRRFLGRAQRTAEAH